MRQWQILFFALLACGSEEFNSLNDRIAKKLPLEGGVILNNTHQRRSGIYFIGVDMGGSEYGYCTGSIVRTSAMRRETWLLTAAHCFDGVPSINKVTMYRNSNLDVIGTPSSGVWSISGHYESGSRNKHDLALVRFPFGAEIEIPSGGKMREWHRPMFGTAPAYSSAIAAVFGMGLNSGDDEWPDGTLRYAETEYDTIGNGNIDADGGFSPDAEPQSADSGGPWLDSGLYDYSYGTNDYLNDGVIAGVHSGEYVYSDYASSTFGAKNKEFLLESLGPSAVFVSYGPWARVCWVDWCEYSPSEQAALIVSVATL